MMNRIKRVAAMLTVLALTLALLGSAGVSAQAEVVKSGKCGANVTWVLDSEGTLTISGTGDMNNYFYSTGNAPWEWNRDQITTVIIEDGVTSIGNYAFEKLRNLTSVTIPDSVTRFGNGAFFACLKLPAITISESVTYVGDEALCSCPSLTSVTIPDSVTTLGSSVLANGYALTEVKLGSNVKELKERAFQNCKVLTTLTIPDSVTSIGKYAFLDCVKLSTLYIGKGVSSITNNMTSAHVSNSAFQGCKALKEICVDSENPAYCDVDGVLFDKAVTELVQYPVQRRGAYSVPATVNTIDQSAFLGCTGLTSITFPEGLTKIDVAAFSDCTGLTAVTIPGSVTHIGERAFYRCTKLASLTIDCMDEVPWVGENVFDGCTKLEHAHILCNYSSRFSANAFGPANVICRVKVCCLPQYYGRWSCNGNTTRLEVVPACGGDYYLCPECDWVGGTGKEHNFQESVVLPTCTEPGYTLFVCSGCNGGYLDYYVPELGHDWDEGTVSKEPNCSEPGERIVSCNRCGESFTEKLPVNGQHIWSEAVVGRPASCVEAGFTFCNCLLCGASRVEPIPAYGEHIWDEGRVTQKPTEDEEGTFTFTCTRCGATRTERIPKLEHVHAYVETETAPTCTEQGYTTHTCRCGDFYVDSYVEPIGHEYDKGIVVKEATVQEAGLMTYTCIRCGNSMEVPILPLEWVNPFTDVKEGAWYYEAVKWANINGVVGGTSATTFRPLNKADRAMLVTILYRMEGSPETDYENPFADVQQGRYYYDAVMWAAANGIVGGKSPDSFAPTDLLTREQTASILYRYAGSLGMDTSAAADLSVFPDSTHVTNYAIPALQWAVANKLINGNRINGELCLDARGTANRAQIAVILMNLDALRHG